MPEVARHHILLGGIGGDSHSVGLTLLRSALQLEGYSVHYLGIQNELKTFFERGKSCHAVMISNMDGHATQYLRSFPELDRRYGRGDALWYLGGNLVVGDVPQSDRSFVEMGFHRVFSSFVDLETVLELLRRDLYPVQKHVLDPGNTPESTPMQTPALPDGTLPEEDVYRARPDVLSHWPTGQSAASLEENAAFLSQSPAFSEVQQFASPSAPALIQPRSGVASHAEQLKLFEAFKRAGVRVLSYQVDSFTRNNNYVGAQEALREGRSLTDPQINGFPVVNHGVEVLRRLGKLVNRPLQVRHSTRDPRLLAEISYAGGVTSFEGGAVCYNIPYYRDYPLSESLARWQYVDRLTGLYNEKFGITLDREFFGTLTATLIPPCLAIVVNLIEAVLAAQQGVKCVSLGYAEQGNRTQDIAAIRMLAELGREMLDNLGHHDVQVNTVFQQYMAAFPQLPHQAEELIYESAITGGLSGATRILVKTPSEAFRIPSIEDNLQGVNLARRGLSAAVRKEVDQAPVLEECDLIRREVLAIFDALFFLGDGHLGRGVVRGFEEGRIDVPFSPSVYNLGEVMTARDVSGAVRFITTGNLPFDQHIKSFHADRMSDRRHAEGIGRSGKDYQLIEKDVLQVARGQYARWPLSGGVGS